MNAPHVSPRTFTLTWIGLLALALASLWISNLPVGSWGMPIALFIAGLKTMLVALFFMELIEQPFVNRFVFLTAVAFVVVFVSLAVADIATRETPPLRATTPATAGR